MTRTGRGPELLWCPSADQIRTSPTAEFRRFVRDRRGLDLRDYDQLWQWSVTHLEDFWSCLWDYYGLDRISRYDAVLVGEVMPDYRWFPGAELNFAEYLLAQGEPESTAVTTVDETGTVEHLDRAALRRQVAGLASTLHDLGVRRGDVVAGYLPNTRHAVVALLATTWLGAIWAAVGQDYSAAAAADRFGQLSPSVLITADGYRFRGRSHPRGDAITQITTQVPTIRHTIVADIVGASLPGGDQLNWAEAIAAPADHSPVRVEFSDPLWVLFSSGTTGTPKGLVHSHGGVLLEMLKYHGLHTGLGRQSRFFWHTSPSWTMWNVLVTGLLTGAGIVCFDGAPTYPDERALWRIVQDLRVTHFGTSPGYLRACEDAGVEPRREFDLTSLTDVGVTGSTLSAELHRWARDSVGVIPVNSISGGTDVVTAFLCAAPELPVWAGELSARALGVRVEAWDDAGHPVSAGQVGELVVTAPMPSMPVGIWGDDGCRLRSTYFDTYPGVWRHGDWMTLTERGSAVLHGRSDATLNRNGVRMGSGDIYAVVEALPAIQEALVVGIDFPDGNYWMPMFVTLRPGQALDDALRHYIADSLRIGLSPRHVPDDIFEVAGIPHTKTGKKLEIPVKRILLGAHPKDVASPEAIDDPALLDMFAEFARDQNARISNNER